MSAHPLSFVSFLAPSMQPVYEAITAYVAKVLGRPTQYYTGTSFGQFTTAGADFGFSCGLPYVLLTRRPNPVVQLVAAPVLQGERYHHQPIYFSDVIVRPDAPYKSFADLKGTVWAYNDIRSHSGYNITRYKLVTMGELAGFFGRVEEAGSHQQAIRLLLAGKIDAAAIDSQILGMELRDQPELKDNIKIIDTLGPAHIQPIVAASTVDPATVAAVQQALLKAHEDPQMRSALDFGLIERLVTVTDSDYDDIRQMVEAAERVGFYVLQ